MIAAVLAGGAGRRMGGGKPARPLAGRPLIEYPLSALAAVCERVAVVAKRDSELPALDAERWDEPDEPRHPRTGIIAALERAAEPVLVCAADMPFVTAGAARMLIAEQAIATSEGVVQPLFGVYSPAMLDTLRGAPEAASLTHSIEVLGPPLVELPPEITRSVDTPAELTAAEAQTRSSR